MKVIIDEVNYIPEADIPEVTDKTLQDAIRQLVSIQYFREHHKAVAQSWDVLNTLAPDVAKLCAKRPGRCGSKSGSR
jgi:hypothetical protein